MGMANNSGTSTTKPKPPPKPERPPKKECFKVPPSTMEEVIPTSITVEDDPSVIGKLLDQTDYVSDTVAATVVMDETSELAAAITAASATGSNITVQFYHALRATSEQRTWQTDFSQSLDNIHYSFLKIENFQMKMTESLQYTYNKEETRSELTGTAILYPYFCPNQGDLFIYNVDDTTGHMGLFKISQAPERMSIKSSTVHQINFTLISYLTTEQIAKLDACVEDIRIFDLDTYLNDEGALLTTGEAATATAATTAVNMLTNFYVSEFYETELYNTFIDSDCLYDPYIVEFITKVIPLDSMPGYPTQLKSNPVEWKRSLWFKLLDPAAVPDKILISRCYKVLNEINYRTTGINALANRCYIAVHKQGKHPYPPFRVPTEHDKEVKTLPMQVRLYLDERKVRPDVLLDLAQVILGASRPAQFYYIPIIIFLLQKLIAAIQNGADIVYNEDTTQEEGDCMDGCINCIYSCNPLHTDKKLCPGAVLCECHTEYIPDDGGCIDDENTCCSTTEHDVTESAI